MRVIKPIHFFLLSFIFLATACQTGENEAPEPKPAKKEVVPDNPQFEFIDSEHSGIDFSNNIQETKAINIVTNSYMYNGGGVAVLDVNNDELPDIYFVSSQENNRLYLNEGNLKFKDITLQANVQALGGFKTGVCIVDINNDGWQDIYVCKSGLTPTEERRNQLFINNGDLTFSEKAAEYGLNDISPSNHANFFDYDLDGDLDLYVLNHPVTFREVNKVSVKQSETGEYIRLTAPRDEFESDKFYKNNGNGTFTEVSEKAGIQNRAFGLSATVSDFNNDNYPDIFIGNDYIEPDLLYINNRKGGFENQADKYFRHTSNHTMGVDIADFNNDGMVDLVALDMIAEDNRRQKEMMTTMIIDRYLSLVKFHYGHQLMRNTLQLNTGDGGFSEIGTLSGISNTDWSWACLLADFDNDSFKDLYITNGYRRDVTNLDYLNYTVDSINRAGGLGVFKDINEYLDLIPSEKLKNYAYRNKGDLTFEKVNTNWGIVQKSYSNGAAYADLDKDGDLDLVVNNIHEKAFLYKNKSIEKGGKNYLQIKLEGSDKNKMGVGSNVTIKTKAGQQYQELTPTRGFFSSVEHLLHFGLGAETMVEQLIVEWGDGKTQTLENLAGNQRITLKYSDAKKGNSNSKLAGKTVFSKVNNTGINFTHLENEFVDFNRERLIPHKLSNLGPSIAVGDVNGDDLDDFYIGGAVNSTGALFIQQSNSTFKKASESTWQIDLANEDVGCHFFDADGDKDLDLYVVSGGNVFPINASQYQDRLYLNDGAGNFSKEKSALPRLTSSGACVSSHDYDGDGDLDLFVGGRVNPGTYPTSPQSFILQNNAGKFSDVTAQVGADFQQIGMVSDLIWADLDGDEKAELIVSGEWMPITIFKNNNGKLKNETSNFGLTETSGWWNCLQAADFDKDGDMDLLAGNLGLNSRIKASPSEPLKIFIKDFDRNGSLDPIIAYYNEGELFPLPLRDLMIKQMPALKKKFVRFRAYADAKMEDVYDAKELASAEQLIVQHFETSYFENKGNGKLERKDLPIEAQLAPTKQICIEDYNADGNLDILLVGNSFSSDTETGRYDAGNGSLFYGNGKGGFDFQANNEHGFWATKEARDLVKIELANGKNLFIVANNNDELETFVLD